MITTLLVANRGEIARRIMRSAHDMGIRTVAVFVEADAHAPFVREAGSAYLLPNGSYLNVGDVLDIARRSGATAVHPGYGFLSENAEFARAVGEAGLIWVGPPPAAIAAMGDKLSAKELAIKHGIPTLPRVEDAADAEAVGYPLLVKAAAGGGGKGMRIVRGPAELDEAVAGARREAASSFGDDRVFLERFVERSRHIEIQVLADAHGNAVHLGERECSIQRRHQKIIEEAPSSVVDEAMRARMGESALRLVGALGYTSAGTVEFLVEDTVGPDGERPFWFLEVNTRLQVEHPVTEAITGMDLVREQIRVAQGEELGYDQKDVSFNGHAIEARLYAEDPATDFLPAIGTLEAWLPALSPSARYDSGVEQGSVISPHFDPMLAKVIAWSPTRHEAALRLALALQNSWIGGVTTNRDFLVNTLRTNAFLAGDTCTDFIARVQPSRGREESAEQRLAASVAALLWRQGHNREQALVQAFMPSGWRNSRMPEQRLKLQVDEVETEVGYRALRDGSFVVNGSVAVELHSWSPDHVEFTAEDRRLLVAVRSIGDRLFLHLPGSDHEVVVLPRFAMPEPPAPGGGLTAPMPGAVLDLRVAVGDRVQIGDVLLILEAMKMEHRLNAPVSGTVTEIRSKVGDQVELGALLLVVEEDSVEDEA
ncbi:biotin carboxylase N-terminal domain-containing protein [Mycobacterium syngnathidarum]